MRKLIVSLFCLVFLAMPLCAEGIDLFPDRLFSAGVGYDFDYNKVGIATLDFLGLYDRAVLTGGYGGVPNLYDALAIGLDVDTKTLTNSKVTHALDDNTKVKLGLYWLGEFREKQDGTTIVKGHGAVCLKVSTAF